MLLVGEMGNVLGVTMPISTKDFDNGESPAFKEYMKKKGGKEKKVAVPRYGFDPKRDGPQKKEPKSCFKCQGDAYHKCIYCSRFYCEEHRNEKKHDCPKE